MYVTGENGRLKNMLFVGSQHMSMIKSEFYVNDRKWNIMIVHE